MVEKARLPVTKINMNTEVPFLIKGQRAQQCDTARFHIKKPSRDILTENGNEWTRKHEKMLGLIPITGKCTLKTAETNVR